MTDVKLPNMGESIAEGTIALWLVDVGQYVEADAPLVQVTTDKADVDAPAPVSGVLAEILAEPGATVQVGGVIARIDEAAARPEPKHPVAAPSFEPRKDGPAEHPLATEGVPAEEVKPEAIPAPSVEIPRELPRATEPAAAPAPDMTAFYSPAVMRLSVEHGVDIRTLMGTGLGGRVTKQDVLSHVGGKAVVPAPVAPVEPVPEPPAITSQPLDAPGFGLYKPPVYKVEDGDTAAPFSHIRRLIADHMVYSKRTSPHVTTFCEVDLHLVNAIKEKAKARVKEEHGIGLTYLPFVTLATVRALNEYPLMNSVVQGYTILTKRAINIGIAVDTERGLFVPVIKDAGGMGLVGLALAINELSIKVRDKKVTPDELTGGTFTVTNPGRKGNLFGTPIISQPQVGILRLGEVVKRAVVVTVDGEDSIVVRPMMYLSLSYDHRVVDGLTANEFLHRIKEHLEAGKFEAAAL